MANDKLRQELGKALADRMGLNHNTTLEDFETEWHGKSVAVKMTSFRLFSEAEYGEVAEVASRRVQEGSEVGE